MMDRLTDFLRRAKAYYGSLPPARRTTLAVSIALSLAITAVLWGYAAYDPMVVLFPDPMDAKTTTAVLDYLEQSGVEHRIEAGSERIYVPRSRRDRLALDLRGKSMVSGDIGAQAMLDDAPIGSTQFMERRRWTMALQRQIEAQINGFDQVMASKVLLSMPEQALFSEDRVDPSASVYVELRTGHSLSTEEGGRVAALVAASVPRLRADKVEILDSELRVIHAARGDDEEFGVSAQMADLRRHYDRYYTSKVERILERVVGPGKVVAQVNVELDHTERTVRQRELDGEGAVVIAQRSRESSTSGGRGDGGVPGTSANLPEIQAASTRTGREASEADEVANVDVPDKQTHIASLPGGIIGLTASVVVDGSWEAPAGAEDAEAGAVPVYVARTAEELDEYAQIVASAIGVTAEQVTIVNRPFARVDLTTETQASTAPPGPDWGSMLPWAAVLLALVMTFAFVIRPAMKGLADMSTPAAIAAAAALEGGDVAGALGEPEQAPEQALAEWLENVASGANYVTRDEVNRLVRTDIVHSVVTLQTWITREQG